MITTIKSVVVEMSIEVQSDDPTFDRNDAKRAAGEYIRTERPGETWHHWDTDLVSYDRYKVTYRQ